MRLVAIAVLTGAALSSVAPAQAGPTKTVRIYDNFFMPETMKVRAGTTVVWRWPGFDEAGDVHDVKLGSGPKGAKRFHSESASTDYVFKRKLTVPGRYKIVCTLHEGMRQTIRVR